RADQAAANTSAPARHWWDPPQPVPRMPTLAAGAVKQASATASAPGQKTFRLKRDKAGDSKPVILDADEVASWTEKNGATEYCVFLLSGHVFAQHGVVQARFQQGVAWVNVTNYKMTGKWHTELYAEGGVRIDNGSTIQEHPQAVFDLTTRGEFKLHTHKSPLV